MSSMLSSGQSTNVKANGSVLNSFRLISNNQPCRQHVRQANTGAVAAAAVCAQAASSTVAASGTDQLYSQDPALDTLIDRWLSHKHASTSAPASNGNGKSRGGGSRRQQRQPDQQVQADWDALLGPVTVTLTALATLEEGDEVFALNDSLSHLGGSLQELQQLATQMLYQTQQQQQQQQDASTLTVAAASYTEQLAQLLHTAAQQVEALDDTGLINLLAIATVLLTAINSTNTTSSSATISSSSSSSGSGYPAVHAAATAAVEATCGELWQRPRVAASLDAAQLTSLAVVLRRLNKLGVDSSALPLSLHLSTYRQLQELAEAGQMSASQLAVCCWCLSSLPVAPPAAAVAAGLRAAAAAATAATAAAGEGAGDSSSALDGLSIRRLSAACINWRPYLTQQLAAAEGATHIAAAAREFVQGAAQLWRLQLDKAGGFTTTTSSSAAGSSSSSSSSDSIWKVALSVAQTAAVYSVSPTEALVEAVSGKLVEQAGLSDAESPTSFRELQDAAAAAGHLLPWWSCLDASMQQQLPQAIFQQQQGQQQQQLLQSFLAGVEHSCCWSVGQLSTDGQQQAHDQLEAITQLLLSITQDSSDRIDGSNSGLSHSLQRLLRSMVAASYTSEQLLPLCAVASQLLQANSAAASADTQGPAAAAVVSAAIALCRLKLPGWQDQLQQLQTVLLEAGGSMLQQLQLKDAIELHAAAAGVAAENAAASSLAAAALQHLMMPATLVSAQPQQAAELLVLLTVGQPPWNMAAGQQLQTAPPAGLQQLMSSRSADGADAAVMLQQQCLRCMSIIVQDSGRSLLPRQLVPVLAAQLFLSQQQQQEQWLGPMSQPMLQSYQQLHRETLAAVSLHLQDCASLLAPGELAWSARLLALLQSRPSLTLAAVIRAAAQSVGQFRRQELKWLLWGLTKLQFTGLRWQQQQLLSAALSSAAAAAAAGGFAAEVEAKAAATPEGEQVTATAAAGAAATADSSSSSSSTAAELDSDIALLWVAASRGSKDPAVLQLLSGVTAHADTPPVAQVASVVWSFTRLAQMGVQQQQQLAALHPQVVQMAERSLCSSTAEQELQPRQIAVLTWGLHRLGHKPSSAAQAALVAAALRQIQLAQPATNTAGTAAVFLPGELSCFLHCLATWGLQLEQQQLQELEVHLQQQLSQGLAAIRHAAAAGRAGAPRASKSSKILWWDGPAICSACWSLARMGATLQPSTLEAAEQHLLQVMPEAPAAPAEAPALQGSTEQGAPQAEQDRSRHKAGALEGAAPPAATDLVLFGTACKGSDYQPIQLLQRFRGWLLMQVARKGAAGLMALRSRGTKPQHSSTAALLAPASTVSDPLRQQQQQRVRPSAPQHAHILVSVLLFLRQTGYDEPLLLQQLESLSVQRPVRVQLDARQVTILLSSFRQLGYVPEQWLHKAGIRLITRHIFASCSNSNRTSAGDVSSAGSLQSPYTTGGFSAQDCVDLLECLAAWHKHPSLSSNTSLQQYVLPGLAQLLLGVQHQQQGPTTAAAAVQRPAAGEALPSSTNGRPAGTADPAAGNAPPSTPLKGSKPMGSATGVSLIPVLHGWQVVSVLRSMVELDPPRFGKLSLLLQQQLLRRMQQSWPEFTAFNQVSAVQAAGRLGYDLSRMLNVQDLVPQAQQGSTEQQQAATASQAWPFASASAASRLLWVFGNVGRHPGPQILPAALSAVEAAARAAAQAGQLLPLREISTSLYAAAVLQELENPAAHSLLQLLQDAAAAGELLTNPQFLQQSEQLAACLIAAQDATQAGDSRAGAGAAAAVAAAIAGDSSQSASTAGTQGPAPSAAPVSIGGSSPWLALPSAVQQRLMEAWRRKAMRKAGQQQGMGEHMQLLLSLRQLGLRGRAKVLTDDGCACIDVAVTTPRGDKLAVELLGPHNAAINTQRPLAPARLKWRVLSSRGYKVVVVNMWEWRSLDSGGLSSKSSRDGGSSSGSSSSSASGSAPESSLEEYDGSVMSEKLLYLQARVQNALGPAAARTWAVGARRVRPLPQQVVLDSRGTGVMPPAAPQRLFPRALRDDRGSGLGL